MNAHRSAFFKVLDYFFHLPTLTVIAILGLTLIFVLFEISLDTGHGFARLNSKLGVVYLYWVNGCCELKWR